MSIDLASLTARLSPEQQRAVKARYRTQAKNPTTAFLLCFFLGLFGVHRFYLGDVAGGIVRLVLLPLILPGLILEVIDLARIDAEVAHRNLATAESIIARVMLDHPDPRFERQAGQLVDTSLASASGSAPAAPSPAAVPLAAAAMAATPEPAPEVAPSPEPALPPLASPAPEAATPREAPSVPVAGAAGPPPPVWPLPPEYHPEPVAVPANPPELRHETDTTPYPPVAPAEPPRVAPAAAPQEAHTVPWGEVAAGAAAGGMAAAALGAHDAPAAPSPAALAGVDLTDQAAQHAEGSALADVGEPMGERVQVRLPGTDASDAAGAAGSTLVFHPEDDAPAHEPDWGTATSVGAGAATILGATTAYETFAHHEPATEPATPAAPADAAALAPEAPAAPVEPAPAEGEPEHRTVKRVRVVRRLMVDGKVVQEMAAEEVVDADADTAATAARLREELGATDSETLASLAQQSVDAEHKP